MLKVITRLRRRRQAWAAAAEPPAAELPPEDAPDMLPADIGGEAGARHICQEIAFTYTDILGRSSRRRVNIHQAWRKGDDLYVRGRCYRRNAMRGFYASRMDHLVDLATGAVIEAPVADYLARHVIGIDPPAAGGGIRAMPADVRCELAILAAFVTADGEAQPAEIALATAHVMRRYPALAASPGGRDALAAHLRRLALSAGEFEDALNRIAGDLPLVEQVRATGAEILAADGVLHQDEIDILDEFDRVVVAARAARGGAPLTA